MSRIGKSTEIKSEAVARGWCSWHKGSQSLTKDVVKEDYVTDAKAVELDALNRWGHCV